ncbi:50S ribosomal protein L23 [bacterium]|jgi:large subunit ribosomal protein L23|nr:50S ribosomal protein L23 [bacterium]|tara:strand:+ start:83 stop:382 length:300 start_codon:yes stop_codon:yes gene_type:complete
MDLSRVIVGPVETEKSERMKASDRTYTIKVAPNATKIDVKSALKKYYDIDATSVRVMRTTSKARTVGRGKVIRKRKPYKKAMVTISQKSKPLDVANFKI